MHSRINRELIFSHRDWMQKSPDAIKRSGSEIGLLIPPTGINETKSMGDLMDPASEKYLLNKPGVNQHCWIRGTGI
jgi:hypothetical protein